MKIPRRPRRKPLVPINAMSDIAFLLLIFIMLISLINYRSEIPIEYPEANTIELTHADKNLEIWVTVDGGIFIKGQAVGLREIEAAIVEAVTTDPTTRIHLLADRRTPYRHVAEVIGVLQLLQHRVVSLVAYPVEGLR